MVSKICTNPECLQPKKLLSEFTKNKNTKDGLSCWCKLCHKEYRDKNEEHQKEWCKNNKDKRIKYLKENKERTAKNLREYRDKNKEKISIWQKQYLNNKYQNNINFKITVNLRNRLYQALKGIFKGKRTLELLGCSVEELKIHLQSQFTDGMTWNNHGRSGWEMDHIKPCSLFDLSKPSEQHKCFHYTNLQPLWRIDNLKKGTHYAVK